VKYVGNKIGIIFFNFHIGNDRFCALFLLYRINIVNKCAIHNIILYIMFFIFVQKNNTYIYILHIII